MRNQKRKEKDKHRHHSEGYKRCPCLQIIAILHKQDRHAHERNGDKGHQICRKSMLKCLDVK